MTPAYIALGSNLQDPQQQLHAAVAALGELDAGDAFECKIVAHQPCNLRQDPVFRLTLRQQPEPGKRRCAEACAKVVVKTAHFASGQGVDQHRAGQLRHDCQGSSDGSADHRLRLIAHIAGCRIR